MTDEEKQEADARRLAQLDTDLQTIKVVVKDVRKLEGKLLRACTGEVFGHEYSGHLQESQWVEYFTMLRKMRRELEMARDRIQQETLDFLGYDEGGKSFKKGRGYIVFDGMKLPHTHVYDKDKPE